MKTVDFDVVIVGGRPAGASLAARLGARGVRVLVIDKAELQSQPAVPSCPVVYPSAMALLDEIGLEEGTYADVSSRCRKLTVQFATHFEASFSVPMLFGRDYVYGIDRASFDHALWAHLARYPSVTARRGVAFLDLVRDADGGVIGIEAQEGDGPKETIRARCVVGADGRFSLVGRKAGARVLEDHADHTSTVYFADWEGLPLEAGDQIARIYATARGTNVMFFPMPHGRVSVCLHMRSDRASVDGDAFYRSVLQRYPWVEARLAGARQVGPLVGLKRIGNRYTEAGGAGWMLVGDALHQKDPVDGQGIYDALVEAKVLDEELAPFVAGERPFAATLEAYRRRTFEATHPMFEATMDRLKRELYEEPPTIVIRTLIRWLLTDPAYQDRFMRFLGRGIAPESWLPPTVVRSCMVRGMARDVRSLFA